MNDTRTLIQNNGSCLGDFKKLSFCGVGLRNLPAKVSYSPPDWVPKRYRKPSVCLLLVQAKNVFGEVPGTGQGHGQAK